MRTLSLIIILTVITLHADAQTEYNVINGKILSNEGLKPVSNAHILSCKSSFGAISDKDGCFRINARHDDTLRISSVGFITQYFPLSEINTEDTITILMKPDNILLPEVEIGPLPDYETFKRMIAEMPADEPFIVEGVNDKADKDMFYKAPNKEPPPASIINPVSLIYNKFNKKTMRKKRMLKNRRKMNRILEKEGRYDEMLPEKLEY